MTGEKLFQPRSGWPMLFLGLFLLILAVVVFVFGVIGLDGYKRNAPELFPLFLAVTIAAPFILITGILTLVGLVTLQPNEACLYTLFGSYVGTARESGFWWANPFMNKLKISLRARNMEGAKLKVNDKQGNPIEIAAVIVWCVKNTAQAVFDVDNYSDYVRIQSESAVRHLANAYAYDHGEEHEITLRSGMDEVSQALRVELQERLGKAGVHVEEARLTHLAYAPEIAQAMLRRQQAEAVIAARQKIVHGAVSMVQMALNDLSEKKVVELDEDRKATMVSNLLVVLCGEAEVHPVINTGTIYN